MCRLLRLSRGVGVFPRLCPWRKIGMGLCKVSCPEWIPHDLGRVERALRLPGVSLNQQTAAMKAAIMA